MNYSGKLQEKNDFVSFLFVCRLLDMYFVDYHKTQCLHIRCYETGDEVSSRIFTSGDISASHQLCVLEKSGLVGSELVGKEASLTGSQNVGDPLAWTKTCSRIRMLNVMRQLD